MHTKILAIKGDSAALQIPGTTVKYPRLSQRGDPRRKSGPREESWISALDEGGPSLRQSHLITEEAALEGVSSLPRDYASRGRVRNSPTPAAILEEPLFIDPDGAPGMQHGQGGAGG